MTSTAARGGDHGGGSGSGGSGGGGGDNGSGGNEKGIDGQNPDDSGIICNPEANDNSDAISGAGKTDGNSNSRNSGVVAPSTPVTSGFSWTRLISVVAFGGIDATLIVLMSYAFQHIHIGDASCLFALRVVWTPIFEALWKRRCLAKGQVVVALLGVLGAILITQPAVLFGEQVGVLWEEVGLIMLFIKQGRIHGKALDAPKYLHKRSCYGPSNGRTDERTHLFIEVLCST